MENLNLRIKELIKALDIKHVDFASDLNITPSYVTRLIKGQGIPSERLTDSICTTYSVNKNWLLKGIKPIFIDRSSSEETFGRFGHLMAHATPEKKAFVSTLIGLVDKLSDEDFNLLQKEYERALLDAKKESQ